MDERIYAAAELIQGSDGAAFLRFMSDVYHGLAKSNGDPISAKAWRSAEKIGMVRSKGSEIELTTPGFLVANVAKEYCHYINHGRTTALPKPAREMFAGKDVLDLGCSFGRTLWEFQRDANSAVGLEPQAEYILLGRALSALEHLEAPKIIEASAESMNEHFGPASLDMIFSRLVLNYVNVKTVLEKMVEALKPGGILWIQVDSPRELPRRFFDAKSMRRRGWVLLAMANLPFCILTRRQISISSGGRMHTRHHPAYLPLWWWRRELKRQGLTDFRHYPSEALVFSARK